ncbi:IPT/TIG domain-containing protein, partial [Chloroflexota bacterium]
MKRSQILRSVAIAIILALIIVAVPTTPALAGVTLYPTSGPAGTTITISGTGFTDGETYTVTFAWQTVYAQVIGSGTITSGAITAVNYTIPALPAGTYTIRVLASGGLALTGTFTVVPKTTLDKTSGLVGDEITLDGTSFTANSNIIIYFVNEEVGTADANASGSFSNAVFTVPESYNGSHTVKAQDNYGNYATGNFSTKQSVAVTPTTGSSGDQATLEGKGFRARNSITVTFNNVAVATIPPSVTTDDYGSFSATFTVPIIVTGSYPATAKDQGNNQASA